MILSSKEIKVLYEKEELHVHPPLQDKNIRPNGIRIHLDNEFLLPIKDQTIDIRTKSDINYDYRQLSDEQTLVLKPNEFILGSSYEQIKTPNDVIGHLEGRSTIARLGLQIHCSSGVIDNMYEQPRKIIFEIKNIGNFNIILYPQMPIGMLLFSKLTSPVYDTNPQYQNQTSIVGPNLKNPN